MPKYTPNGEALNDHEKEVLVILIEEAAEVIQAATKLLRFGKEDRPDEINTDNTTVLGLETGDLYCMISMAMDLGLINWQDIISGQGRKKKRLETYMQTERSR